MPSTILSDAADKTDQSSIPNINGLVDEREDEIVFVPAFGVSDDGRQSTTLPGTENGRVEQQGTQYKQSNDVLGNIFILTFIILPKTKKMTIIGCKDLKEKSFLTSGIGCLN